MRIEQLDSLFEAAVKRGDAEAAKEIHEQRAALLERDRIAVMERLARHNWKAPAEDFAQIGKDIHPDHAYQLLGKD